MYREYPAPEALTGLVECFWRRELTKPGADTSGVILPDGRVDVIWTARGPTLVAGPQTRFLPRPLQAPFVAIGARFCPGVGPPLLGLPAHELVDMHVSLTEIDTRPAARLNDQLAALADPGLAVTRIGDALAELADGAGALDPVVRGAARILDGPGTTVRYVASEVAMSERQLERRFRESVGYGPKTLQRILRFRRFLSELGKDPEGSGDLARIAAETGYSDQAHLTRGSRELSGLTPTQLKRLWQSDRVRRPSGQGARSPAGS
jgi:AraC-like DNA-binding protein